MSGAAALPAAIAGSAGLGFLGNQQTNAANERMANTPTQQNTQGTYAPSGLETPGYGYLGGILEQMGINPAQYFPGQGYVGPSAATQQGVDMGMGSLPYYEQGAGKLNAAGGLYGEAANNLRPSAQFFHDASASGRDAASNYSQAAGMGQGVADAYGGAAGLAPGVTDAYGGAASLAPGVTDAYGAAAGMAPGVANSFGLAQQIGGMGLPLYGQAGGQALGAQGGQHNILGTSGGNYSMLSGAADVANSPYVQGQIQANERSVKKGLLEDVLPQLQDRGAQVNALGSSRLGLAQGQAVGDAAEALANTNASTLLNAYGQGLGAQQSALGQTGAMLQNQMAPAQSTAWAAMQGNNAMNQAGQMAGYGQQGMNAMGLGAGYLGQGMNAAGLGAGYLGQGMNAAGLGAGYLGQGMNAMGNAGAYMDRNAASLGQAGRDAREGAMTPALMADLIAKQGGMSGQAGDMLNRGGQAGANWGQLIEGYQQKALDDAMSRHQWAQQEPWNRANNIMGVLGGLQGLGTQYGNSASMGPAGAYQSPTMGALQGGLGGAMLGYGMYRNGMFGGNYAPVSGPRAAPIPGRNP